MSRQRLAACLAGLLCCSLLTPLQAADLAARGASLLAPFKAELKSALQTGLAEGPIAAVEACRLQAPAIAVNNSSADISVGRSSHRLRNPDNAPSAWMQRVLDDYLNGSAAPAPRLTHLGNGRVAYAEPILTQGVCLVCHGARLDPAVADILARRYPDDAATGFEAGELRGIFWVEFPAAMED
jgi:hypothetical protein